MRNTPNVQHCVAILRSVSVLTLLACDLLRSNDNFRKGKMVLAVVAGGGVLLLFLGIWEKRTHSKRLSTVPLRINVNGIRGKSTATRLITSLLAKTGTRTLGKTTGTSARVLLPNGRETPVKRAPRGPNIGEQKHVVAQASREQVTALVCECMAVTPDYQITFQEQYLQAQIGVIVNVLEDHMDLMGPTLDQVAEAFYATIPYNGWLVTVPGPYLEDFREIARQRGSQVEVARPEEITAEMLDRFPYVVFPENLAIALAVARILDIDQDEALEAIYQATPDPGATKIYPYVADSGDASDNVFVNGFAVNDADSTVKMFERTNGGDASREPLYVMNCREDRIDRTEQFATDVFPKLPAGILITIGGVTRPISEAVASGRIRTSEYVDLEGASTEQIIQAIDERLGHRFIFGVGNIHGAAAGLVSHFTGEEFEE